MRSGLETAIRRAASAVLNALYPPLCLSCRAQVATPDAFCLACWEAIEFLEGPMCDCCGVTFEFATEPGALCASCLAKPPAFDRARAVLRYDDTSKAPILALKHADRLHLVPAFVRWLGRSGHSLLEDADLIVPVPLHRLRLWTRRYNQSAELVRGLSRLTGKPAKFLALVRRRATPSQGAMPSAKARRRNMTGAFVVPAGHKTAIAGRNILLVDDVLTTGATVEACARALKRAGATKGSVLALARVVRPLVGGII